jgi:hypothetical protein
MPNLKISVNYRFPLGGQLTQIEGLRRLITHLQGVAAGRVIADSVKYSYNDSVAINSASSYGGQAAGVIVMATSTGTVGATIGGTAKTVTWATSDIASQTALAAAIRADATLGMFCTASNKLAKLTVASVVAGTTVDIWNTTFTALASGISPTTNPASFSVGASDTACALNLATAICRHPSLAGRVRAVSVLGVVYIGMVDDRVPAAYEGIRNPSATTITVNTPLPVAGAVTMVFANDYGILGNFVTVVASGTNVTFSTNGTSGQLGNGTGGALPSFTQDVIP